MTAASVPLEPAAACSWAVSHAERAVEIHGLGMKRASVSERRAVEFQTRMCIYVRGCMKIAVGINGKGMFGAGGGRA